MTVEGQEGLARLDEALHGDAPYMAVQGYVIHHLATEGCTVERRIARRRMKQEDRSFQLCVAGQTIEVFLNGQPLMVSEFGRQVAGVRPI